MTNDASIDYWAEAAGGFRGSTMVRLGAIALSCGGLANLAAQLLAVDTGPSQLVTVLAWLLFILGLWLLAAGFFWVGAHPALPRFGFVVGTFHALQGVQLLVLLFSTSPPIVPPISLTVGRLLATVFFAIFARGIIPTRPRTYLAVSASLLLVKAIARSLGFLPAMSDPLEPLLDAVLLIFMASALFQVGTMVRHEETAWAKHVWENRGSDFADFNNPEHAWNKK